jgi:predicted ATP-binding protein involved in virulence
MKLERLSLANFRGFKQLDITFEPDLTIIAGANGTGKSAILKATAMAVSHVLPKLTPSLENPLDLSADDIHAGASSLTMSAAFSIHGANVRADVTRSTPRNPSQIEELNIRRNDLRFAIRGTERGSQEHRELEEDLRKIEQLLRGKDDTAIVRIFPPQADTAPEAFAVRSKADDRQPLAVFYSTSRFLSRLPPVMPKAKSVEVATAFRSSLTQVEVSLNEFGNWIRVMDEGAIRRPDLKETIRAQLEVAVQTMLPGFSRLELQDAHPPRFSINKEGNRLFLEQLSDGERGLLALVFDLTRRLAIANPESDHPIAEGAALVLVDELELHLHPKWQRDVLGRLRSVFQQCQFVVTTHSPLVLGEVEARCVRFLEFEDGKVVARVPTEAYGLDANRILQELMGARIRTQEVERNLKMLFELIDDERFDQAREKLASLEESLGSDEPELTRANTLIRFLEGDE